jgi:transcriptional regulator GlxA family with amidase domain
MALTNIVFLLFPDTHLLDMSGPAQVFYEANGQGKELFRLHFASQNKSLLTRQGLLFANLTNMEDLQLQRGDLICIPGIDLTRFCEGRMDDAIRDAKKWVRQQYKKGVCLSSICSGALILAEMGMLNGVRCTTHWKCLPYAKKRYPKAFFTDDILYAFDKDIFTSAGMTAGIDMALALVEKWTNPLLAAKIAREMVINIRRVETRSQQNIFLDFKNHFNADVYKAQEILADRLDASYTIRDLAKELNMSDRQLARLFKSHTRQTIQAYRENQRLEHGQQLLFNTELSVKQIAFQCGYESSRQFTRLWKNRKEATPLESRRNYALSLGE